MPVIVPQGHFLRGAKNKVMRQSHSSRDTPRKLPRFARNDSPSDTDQFLAIDQGTHSSRAIVYDDCGNALASAHQEVKLVRHSDTKIEQSPEEILKSVQTVIAAVLSNPNVSIDNIRAAGLATQRSSVVAWDRVSGKALSPVLSWQDRRTEASLHSLKDHKQDIEARTGLRLSPHYGASKLQWLLNEVEKVRTARESGTLVMAPLASYLLFHLTQEKVLKIDHANASRTLLWNLESRDWDAEMLSRFNIPAEILPTCQPITHHYGLLEKSGIPITAVNGDQTAALYAQGQPPNNTLVINIGTGAFVLMPTKNPEDRPSGLLAGISHSNTDNAQYYLEGTVNSAGSAIEYVAKLFGIADVAAQLPHWLNTIQEPTLFINTLNGLGAPWWKAGIEPYFLDSDVDAAEAMVATIESIVFLLQNNIDLICQSNTDLKHIQISGGLANIDGLCQKLANLSGLEINRSMQTEATARGIAWQAMSHGSFSPTHHGVAVFTPIQNSTLKSRYTKFSEIIQEINSH